MSILDGREIEQVDKRRGVVTTEFDSGLLTVVGPFDDDGAAMKWGREWQRRNADDPSWNVVNWPVVVRFIATERADAK